MKLFGGKLIGRYMIEMGKSEKELKSSISNFCAPLLGDMKPNRERTNILQSYVIL